MTNKEWLSVAGLAEELELLDADGKPNIQAIHWMVYKGTAPRHYKIAGKLRFRRNDIEESLESHRVDSRVKAS